MGQRSIAALAAVLTLGACAASVDGTVEQDPEEVPEAVATLAGPNQDLQTVHLRPEDGCYWYRYVGPVETTMLPLRTAQGERICAGSRGVDL